MSMDLDTTFAVISEPDHLAHALKSRYNAPTASPPIFPSFPEECDEFWRTLATAFNQ